MRLGSPEWHRIVGAFIRFYGMRFDDVMDMSLPTFVYLSEAIKFMNDQAKPREEQWQ